MARELVVKIAGDAKGAMGAIGQVEGGAGRLGRAFGAIAATAATAFAAVGVAAGAAAAQGVREFAGFQQGMNEVFTLLPGISQQSMGQMQRHVRDFALEMGVATDQVVPALYQALSAGVPQDNVFEFLEVAQQAAMGGVTDLTTAVGAVSGVVNAYGDGIIEAAQASDLMFTAVRTGTTTFGELAGALGNVTPVAATSGVEFSNVTAALARMTLTMGQGSTSQATTQLRQMLLEVGDAGTEVGEAFSELAGSSLPDFLAAGNDLGDVMDVLNQAATEAGVPINQLFGSVEAGQAAILLGGSNLDSFRSSLDEMGSSAGATQAAFDQMDQGLARVWDRVSVVLNELWLSIGEQLAPVLEDFGAWVQANMPQIQEAMAGAIQTVADFIRDRAIPAFQALQTWWTENGPAVVVAVQTASANIVTAFTTVRDWVTTTFGSGGSGQADLQAFVATVTSWATQIGSIVQSAIDLISAAWAVFGDDLVTLVGGTWEAVRQIIDGALDLIQGALEVFAGVFTGDWKRMSDGLRQMWDGLWSAVNGAFDGAVTYLRTGVAQFAEYFRLTWQTFTGGTRDDWDSTWRSINDAFNTWWGTLRSGYDASTASLAEAWGGFTGGIGKTWNDLWSGIQTGWGTISETLKGLVGGLVSTLGGVWDGIRNALGAPVNWVIDNVINGLISAVNQVSRVLTGGNVIDPISFRVPTFHDGGVVGEGGRMTGGPLRRGERIIKALDGEEVLRPDDPRHRDNLPPGTAFAETDTYAPETGGPREWIASIGDVLGSVASQARELIAATVRPLIQGLAGPVDSMASRFGVPGQIVAGAGRQLVDQALDWLTGVEEELTPALDPSGGYAALIAYLQGTGVPHRVTSTLRPGAVTASGNPSRHASGLAADFAGPTPTRAGYGSGGLRAIFEAFVPVAEMLNELILAGAPFNIKRGRRVAPYAVAQHWDHVHAALAKGGIVTEPITALMGEAGPEAVIPLDDPRAATWLGGNGFGQTSGGFATDNPLQALIDLLVDGWRQMIDNGRDAATMIVDGHREMWARLWADSRTGTSDMTGAFDAMLRAFPTYATAVDRLTDQVIAAAERATAAAAAAQASAAAAAAAAVPPPAPYVDPVTGGNAPGGFGRPSDPAPRPTAGPYAPSGERGAGSIAGQLGNVSSDDLVNDYADALAGAVRTAVGQVVDRTMTRVVDLTRSGVR